MNDSTSRRAVVKTLGLAGAAAALPWKGVLGAAAQGSAGTHLDVKDPAAVAQAYVEDVSQVDPKKTPEFAPGSSCENCLQLQGTAGDSYRPCSLFPGKLVSVKGWCKAWTAEM